MTPLTAADYARFPYAAPDHEYEYGADEQQFGELYLPASSPPHSAIVLVHGGCYYANYDLRPVSLIARNLAQEGFAVWNIEYRRAGNGGNFPNMFRDVAAATDYLRVIADQHGLDLSRVIAIGHSAGGHLALWLAGRNRLAESSLLYSPHPLPIAGVIGLAPIADISHALDTGLCGDALPLVLGSQEPDTRHNIKDASPVDLLPLGVPQIHLIGAEDNLIRANLQRYVAAASAAGDELERIVLQGAGHFELVAVDSPEWQRVVTALHSMRSALTDELR